MRTVKRENAVRKTMKCLSHTGTSRPPSKATAHTTSACDRSVKIPLCTGAREKERERERGLPLRVSSASSLGVAMGAGLGTMSAKKDGTITRTPNTQ
jgi:hypothetical protein